MKRLQEHLYSGMGEDGNLQEEKRRINEQFKFSSARARRFAVENNRRRRSVGVLVLLLYQRIYTFVIVS